MRSPFRVRRGSPPPPPRQRRLLATTRDAFHRQVLPGYGLSTEAIPGIGWEPVTVRLASPRGVGFRGPFANLCSREGWLGSVPFRALFTRGGPMPGTACRLLQSKRSTSTTTKVRAPQHHTRSRPLVQLFSRRSRPFGLVPGCGWRVSLARAGQPRFHGSGVALEHGDAGPMATSPTAIARGRSFAPTRSTRAPRVASRDERRPETTASSEARCARLPRLTSHRDARAPPCVPGPAAAGAPG